MYNSAVSSVTYIGLGNGFNSYPWLDTRHMVQSLNTKGARLWPGKKRFLPPLSSHRAFVLCGLSPNINKLCWGLLIFQWFTYVKIQWAPHWSAPSSIHCSALRANKAPACYEKYMKWINFSDIRHSLDTRLHSAGIIIFISPHSWRGNVFEIISCSMFPWAGYRISIILVACGVAGWRELSNVRVRELMRAVR